MRIGTRAHDFGRFSPDDLAKKIHSYGLSAAQLAVPKAIDGINSYHEMTEKQCYEINTAFHENDIEISVLGCYIDPAIMPKEERNVQLAVFLKALEFSKLIGAKMVGTETTNFSLPNDQREGAFLILKDSILRMVEKAEKIGAQVAIEPVSAHTLNTPELTFRLINEVNSKRLSIIFDPINLLTPSVVPAQNKLWEECFEAFGNHIGAVHIKDAQVCDNKFMPCPLGTGIMEYTKIIAWLKQNKLDISILREELDMKTAKEDISFMKALLED